eukprot:444908_1
MKLINQLHIFVIYEFVVVVIVKYMVLSFYHSDKISSHASLVVVDIGQAIVNSLVILSFLCQSEWREFMHHNFCDAHLLGYPLFMLFILCCFDLWIACFE